MSRELLHPKYWPLWFLVGLMRLLVLMPYTWQLKLGRGLGLLAFKLMSKRRRIAKINIDLCFPEKTELEREQILRDSFKNLGMGVMEALMAWFMSKKRFANLPIVWQNHEHYQKAQAAGKSIIFLYFHMSCLELGGRFLAEHTPSSYTVYKKSHDPFFEYLISGRRKKYLQALVPHMNLKAMIKSLRTKGMLSYAPDQDFGAKVSVFVPWFNIPTATVTATSLLAEKGNALVVPMCIYRTKAGVYEINSLPAFDHFPSGDIKADCERWQKILEDLVRQYPEQYLWIHKRFKTQPEGMPSVYS